MLLQEVGFWFETFEVPIHSQDFCCLRLTLLAFSPLGSILRFVIFPAEGSSAACGSTGRTD